MKNITNYQNLYKQDHYLILLLPGQHMKRLLRLKLLLVQRRENISLHQIATYLKQLIKIFRATSIQNYKWDSQSFSLKEQLYNLIIQILLQHPISQSTQNITKYIEYLDIKHFNVSIESSFMIQNIKKYKKLIYKEKQRKCLNCCPNIIKNYPLNFHCHQMAQTPFMTIQQNSLTKEELGKMMSALANQSRGIVIIAGKIATIFKKPTILKGLENQFIQQAIQRMQMIVAQAKTQLKQVQVFTQVIPVPLQQQINSNIVDYSVQAKQYVIKIVLTVSQDSIRSKKLCYVQKKQTHQRSLYRAYKSYKQKFQFICCQLKGQQFYKQIHINHQKSKPIKNICPCFGRIQEIKHISSLKLPKIEEIKLKRQFTLPKDDQFYMREICNVFKQNEFEKEVPQFSSIQTCVIIQLPKNHQVEKSINKIQQIFKQCKIHYKKWIPFKNLQVYLQKLLAQQSEAITYLTIVFIYDGKPNNLEDRLKQIEDLQYQLNFVTPKITPRYSMSKTDIDSFKSLIQAKYGILPKIDMVKIKNMFNISFHFKDFAQQKKKGVIFAYIVLLFSKKKPKCDNLNLTAWE